MPILSDLPILENLCENESKSNFLNSGGGILLDAMTSAEQYGQ